MPGGIPHRGEREVIHLAYRADKGAGPIALPVYLEGIHGSETCSAAMTLAKRKLPGAKISG